LHEKLGVAKTYTLTTCTSASGQLRAYVRMNQIVPPLNKSCWSTRFPHMKRVRIRRLAARSDDHAAWIAAALGFVAVGALAIGAVAIGRLTIRRMALVHDSIDRLTIDAGRGALAGTHRPPMS